MQLQNETTNKKALKAGVWYTASNFLVKAAAFITTPIFTRLLLPEEVGAYANVSSWFAILVIITTFDLYSAVSIARFDYKDELNEYIASTLVLGSMITMGFYAVVIIFKSFFTELFAINELSLHMIFLYCLVYPALQMMQIKNRIEYKYKLVTVLSLTSVLGATLISLALVLVMDDRFTGRLLGSYVPHILLNVIIYIYLLKQAKFISTKYWKYALVICIPLIWHTLAGNLLSSSDRIMITRFCGKADTAFYSVAYSCAQIVSILWNSMNSAWSPWAYEQMEAKNYTALKKASKPFMIGFGIIVFGGLLVAPEVLLIMGGKKYAQALAVLPPVMLGYVFQFVYSLYVNIEFYSKKQNYIAIGTTAAALVNVALNFIFIPLFGYIAAAYTTMVGYIVLFAVHFLFVKRLGKLDWYDTKFNLSFLSVTLLCLPLTLMLYEVGIVRYSLIGILAVAVIALIIIFHKELISCIKKGKVDTRLFREKFSRIQQSKKQRKKR